MPCLYELMQNLYLILISFQRVPLDFDDKSGLWYLERELPVSEIVKTGLVLLVCSKLGLNIERLITCRLSRCD